MAESYSWGTTKKGVMSETLHEISLKGIKKDLFARIVQTKPDESILAEIRELHREKVETLLWEGLDSAAGLSPSSFQARRSIKSNVSRPMPTSSPLCRLCHTDWASESHLRVFWSKPAHRIFGTRV